MYINAKTYSELIGYVLTPYLLKIFAGQIVLFACARTKTDGKLIVL